MKAIHLRTEYLDHPCPLDMQHPRLYWHCEGGVGQTAYQIIAQRNGAPLWDSGKVSSSVMTHIPLGGEELRSRDEVTWRVRLWDENDRPGEWAESGFEVGFLKESDWTAKWITAPIQPKKHHRYPVDLFRRQFTAGSVKKARLYITACGLYEAELNGHRVGDFVLAPGSTDYQKHIQYQVYDVTELLQKNNILTVSLADGWYRGSVSAYGQVAVYGRQTKLCAQLEITDDAGKRTVIGTDDSWAWCNDGPIAFADLKDGERVDFRKSPTFGGKAKITGEKSRRLASHNVPVTEHEVFTPKLLHTPDGKTVLDFRQNIAGFIACVLQGKPGQRVTIRLGETLDESGNFTQKNFQLEKPVKEWGTLGSVLLMTGMGDKLPGEKQKTPLQEARLTLSGNQDTYKTRFSIAGFRYALVEGLETIRPENWQAIAVYSDMEDISRFESSDPRLNRLFDNIKWSMKGNFADVPTDCPTRERLGWTGDAQVFFSSAAHLMDVTAFYRKYLLDLEKAQLKSGVAPSVAPFSGMSLMYDNSGVSVGWCDAMVLIPYRYWKQYGDVSILRRFYPMMKKYGLYLTQHTGMKDKKQAQANPYNRYTYMKGVHLGEWLEPKDLREQKYGAGVPHPEECTAYLHYTMRCLSEIAQALNEQTDQALWAEYAEGAKKAYQYLFLQKGAPNTDRQAKLVRPLALGLCEGDEKTKAAVQKRLIQAVHNRDWHVATGFLSTAFLPDELTKAGAADDAWKMLLTDTAPGWLYEVKQGATTIWEDWSGDLADPGGGSLNHYSPGAVADWMMRTAAGIQVDGANHFRIAPVPGKEIDSLAASETTLYGTVKTTWKRENDQITLTVVIPANTEASLILPDGTETVLHSGTHIVPLA